MQASISKNGAVTSYRAMIPVNGREAMIEIPYSLEAELAVIGSFLMEPQLFTVHASELSSYDFFDPGARNIFLVMLKLAERKENIRLETLAPFLEKEDYGTAADAIRHCLPIQIEIDLQTVLRDSARRKRLAEIESERERIINDPDFLTGEPGGLSARDAIDLVNDASIVEPPVLVSGMLHKGSALLLGAASKSYKSWSLIDLAVSVANGAAWWNLPCVKGQVLFVDFELTPHFWRKRAIEIAQARALNLNGIRVLNCRGHSSENALRVIDKESKAQAFALVCIDPLYSFLAGKDENSAGDVGAVMRRLAMLSESTGAAMAISHHFSKGNQSAKEAIDRFSGSGVFARFPDVLLVMTKHEEDAAFTVDPTVRNFPPVASFVLRWQHPLMVRDGTLDPARLKKPPGAFQAKYTLEQVLEVIGSKVLTAREIELACHDAHKMSDSAVKRLLKKGKDDGKLIQPSAGLWQRVTGSRP